MYINHKALKTVVGVEVKVQYFPLKERGAGLGGGDCWRDRRMREDGVLGRTAGAAGYLDVAVRAGNSVLKKVRFSGGWFSAFPQPLFLQEVGVAR